MHRSDDVLGKSEGKDTYRGKAEGWLGKEEGGTRVRAGKGGEQGEAEGWLETAEGQNYNPV